MASLDNFHTDNGPTRVDWPSLDRRMNRIKYGVNESFRWDVPANMPVAPIQPQDPRYLLNDHPDSRFTEYMHRPVNAGLYVPTMPRTVLQKGGDTAEGMLLYEQPGCCPVRNGWKRFWQRLSSASGTLTAPVKTRDHRWQPY